MSLLIVGSVALDTIETPLSRVENVLGGAGVYASLSSSFFVCPFLIGVVGEDFPREYEEFLSSCSVDLSGFERKPGKTFHWEGKYLEDFNTRKTICTDLNVFEEFKPSLKEKHRKASYILLANIHPSLQLDVLAQLDSPRLIACDTMNLWIENAREELEELIKKIHILLLNDEEARMLSGESQLVRAGKKLLEKGLLAVVIKKGEHGASLFSGGEIFYAPAYPVEQVVDPTGAGDCFAGAFMGYLARSGRLDFGHLRRASIYGAVVASFGVEDFSINRLKGLKEKEIIARYNKLKKMVEFD